MKVKSIEISPYGQELLIVYKAKSAKQAMKKLNSVLKTEGLREVLNSNTENMIHHSITSNAGMFLRPSYGEKRLAIIVINTDDHGVIVHEVCHFVFWLFHMVGIPLKVGHDEAYTYLIEDTYKKITNILGI